MVRGCLVDKKSSLALAPGNPLISSSLPLSHRHTRGRSLLRARFLPKQPWESSIAFGGDERLAGIVAAGVQHARTCAWRRQRRCDACAPAVVRRLPGARKARGLRRRDGRLLRRLRSHRRRHGRGRGLQRRRRRRQQVGSVYVFHRATAAPVYQVAKDGRRHLVGPLRRLVAIDGATVVVGASGAGRRSSLRLPHDRRRATYVEVAKLTADDASIDQFGGPAAIAGGTTWSQLWRRDAGSKSGLAHAFPRPTAGCRMTRWPSDGRRRRRPGLLRYRWRSTATLLWSGLRYHRHGPWLGLATPPHKRRRRNVRPGGHA